MLLHPFFFSVCSKLGQKCCTTIFINFLTLCHGTQHCRNGNNLIQFMFDRKSANPPNSIVPHSCSHERKMLHIKLPLALKKHKSSRQKPACIFSRSNFGTGYYVKRKVFATIVRLNIAMKLVHCCANCAKQLRFECFLRFQPNAVPIDFAFVFFHSKQKFGPHYLFICSVRVLTEKGF